MVAFNGNPYPHTSHLVLFAFSVVILAHSPFEVAGNGGIAHCISRMDFGKQLQNPCSGNATPILFNNRQQKQSNKIVVRKLPPGAYETKKRCCLSVGLSYRIFQIAAKKIYNHLTTMEVANRQTIRNVDSIFRGGEGKRLIRCDHLPTAWVSAVAVTAVTDVDARNEARSSGGVM